MFFTSRTFLVIISNFAVSPFPLVCSSGTARVHILELLNLYSYFSSFFELYLDEFLINVLMLAKSGSAIIGCVALDKLFTFPYLGILTCTIWTVTRAAGRLCSALNTHWPRMQRRPLFRENELRVPVQFSEKAYSKHAFPSSLFFTHHSLASEVYSQ